MTNVPNVCYSRPAIVLVSGNIYVHGGYGTNYLSLHRFSLKAEQWTRLTGLRYRLHHSNVLVDDKMYVVGGFRHRNNGDLPIEAFDLVTNTVEEFEPCPVPAREAAYVESRREVIILASRGSIHTAQVFGFNVDTGRINSYKVTSMFKPIMDPDNIYTVQKDMRLFVLSSNIFNGQSVSILTLGRTHEAAWSRLTFKGAALPQTAYLTFEVVHGLLVLFGGQNIYDVIPEEIFLIDPDSFEAVQLGPSSTADLVHMGAWPMPPDLAGSVASNGKLWIFGGNRRSKILELEFERTE